MYMYVSVCCHIDSQTPSLSHKAVDSQPHIINSNESENLNYNDINLEVGENLAYQITSVCIDGNPSYDVLKTDMAYEYISLSNTTVATSTSESIYY